MGALTPPRLMSLIYDSSILSVDDIQQNGRERERWGKDEPFE